MLPGSEAEAPSPRGELCFRAAAGLLAAVRDGAVPFEREYGASLFEYLSRNPERGAEFQASMADRSRRVANAVVAAYDFGPFARVVDVGGGSGTLLAAILEANPGLRGVLFNQSAVVERARERLGASAVAGRCEFVAGDIFSSLPPGSGLSPESGDSRRFVVRRRHRRGGANAVGHRLGQSRISDRSPAPAAGGNRSAAPVVSGLGSLAGGRPLDDDAARTNGHDEPDLIERARRGDHDAYGTLVRRHQDLAFRTAYLVLRDAAEAEDAAQEGFVKAYFALPRFRSGAPFRPWLLRIVINEARNRRVAAARRSNLALRAASADAAAVDPDSGLSGRTQGVPGRSGDAAPSPEAAALAHEQAAELLAAINALREEDRAVIACRYFLDLSEAETAAALGLPRGTVKSRLSRALGRARALLTTDAGGRDADG